jgi:hypothetical protein
MAAGAWGCRPRGSQLQVVFPTQLRGALVAAMAGVGEEVVPVRHSHKGAPLRGPLQLEEGEGTGKSCSECPLLGGAAAEGEVHPAGNVALLLLLLLAAGRLPNLGRLAVTCWRAGKFRGSSLGVWCSMVRGGHVILLLAVSAVPASSLASVWLSEVWEGGVG